MNLTKSKEQGLLDKNIVLIGLMGSGKSMIARRLAGLLKAEWVAVDDLIEEKTGQAINEIFGAYGEEHFRKLEADIIREVSQRRGIIIDCGGGVVCTKENLPNLKTNGIVFYLKARPDIIYQRIRLEGHRPLLKVPDPLRVIQELYDQRLPLYNQADYVIDANDASIEGPVAEILKRIQ